MELRAGCGGIALIRRPVRGLVTPLPAPNRRTTPGRRRCYSVTSCRWGLHHSPALNVRHMTPADWLGTSCGCPYVGGNGVTTQASEGLPAARCLCSPARSSSNSWQADSLTDQVSAASRSGNGVTSSAVEAWNTPGRCSLVTPLPPAGPQSLRDRDLLAGGPCQCGRDSAGRTWRTAAFTAGSHSS